MLAAVGLTLTGWAAGATQARAWEMRVCADPDYLPYSHEDGTGFENRIAAILAEELDAELTYLWRIVSSRTVTRLREAECDLVIGAQDGQTNMLSTIAYYRSPFVFVYRADSGFDINSFDDPRLSELRIGVQPSAGPAHDALLSRGLVRSIVREYNWQLETIFADIANGDLDVGVIWGPAAGHYSALQAVELEMATVTPLFEPPFVPMYVNMTIGVRPGDESLRDRLDIAIVERWDEIQVILEESRVPLLPLVKPMATLRIP